MPPETSTANDRKCENLFALLFAFVGFIGGAVGVVALSAAVAVALSIIFALIGMFGGLVLGHFVCAAMKKQAPAPPARAQWTPGPAVAPAPAAAPGARGAAGTPASPASPP